jgi:Rrf2 family protein
VRISAKTEYACIAMLELAARYESGEMVRIGDIAREHAIPPRFLVQILLHLKSAGLLSSTRGASGGYRLLRPPEEISLGEIVEVVEGPQTVELKSAAGSPWRRVLEQAWQDAVALEQQHLRATTLAQLLQRAREPAEGMYYI